MSRFLGNLIKRPRFLLHVFFAFTSLLLLVSVVGEANLGISLPVSRDPLLVIFAVLFVLEIIPLISTLVQRMLDTEGLVTRGRVLTFLALVGIVLVPAVNVLVGDPPVSILISLFYAAFLWSLFWTIRERLDPTPKRLSTVLANVMAGAPVVVLAMTYFAPELLVPGQVILLVFELLLYTVVLFVINSYPPPEPDLPEFVAQAGRLYFEDEEVTPENWADHHKKVDARTRAEKNAGKELESVGEIDFRPDTAVVVDVGQINPRIIRWNSDDRKIWQGEDLRAVVDLRNQVRVNAEGVRALTEDGLHIDVGVGVSFHIARAGDAALDEDPYPALDEAILEAVYKANVSEDGQLLSWDGAPLGMVAGVLRNEIARHELVELFEYKRKNSEEDSEGEKSEKKDPPRKKIAGAVREAAAPALAKRGITLTSVFLLDFKFDEIEILLQNQWIDIYDRRAYNKLLKASATMEADATETLLGPLARLTGDGRVNVGAVVSSVEDVSARIRRMVQMVEEEIARAPMRDRERIADQLANIRRHQDDLVYVLDDVKKRTGGGDERAKGLEEELEDARLEIATLKNKRRRASVPFERIVSEALQILDDLDRGVANINQHQIETQPKAVAYAYTRSFEVLRDRMVNYFDALNLEEVPARPGQPFDSHYHEAIGWDPSSSRPHGSISRVEGRGYMYDGRLLRPARVWVSGVGSSSGERRDASRAPGSFSADGYSLQSQEDQF